MTIVLGDTVKGAFPVEMVDPATKKASQITLADHHAVVVAVMGATLLLAYAGTDDDPANRRRPGFVPFEMDVNGYVQAGWRIGGNYYIDAGRLAFVPANKVAKVGKLGRNFFSKVAAKAGSLRQSPLTFSAKDSELVTGARRQDKSQRVSAFHS